MRMCVMCPDDLIEQANYCPFCGVSVDDALSGRRDPTIGRLVDARYRLESRLGAGGMGVVYRALDVDSNQFAALKLLNPRCARDEEDVLRFRREARAASRLDHPHSVQVLSYGQDSQGVLFLAMELIEGESLGALVRRQGPLQESRVARLTKLVCSALAEAHALGIVHRDLKPDNIMLDGRTELGESVKVLDYGLAKLLIRKGEDLRTLTKDGMIFGTPEYMAPETVTAAGVDARTDIYSLGAVMYHLLTGRPPFLAKTAAQVAAMQVLQAPPAMSTFAPELKISASMQRVVLRCLAKKPLLRFQSAMELAQALDPIAKQDAPTLPPAGLAEAGQASRPPQQAIE